MGLWNYLKIGLFFINYLYLKKLGVNSDTVSEGLAFGLLFGILGARLYYVLFSGQHYDGFLDVINPSNGGLAIHGAIIAVAIYVPMRLPYHRIGDEWITDIQ